jgi:predicted PurR-regulated permease PerM
MQENSVKQTFLPPLWILGVAILALFFWLLFALKEIVFLLVIGYSIAYVIEPALKFFERKGISRVKGVFLVAGIACLLFALLLVAAVPPLYREGTELLENLPKYIETVKGKLAPLVASFAANENSLLHGIIDSPLDELQKLGKDLLPKVLEGGQSVLLGGYSVTLTLVNLALLPFIVFYLAVDFPKIRAVFIRLLPKSRRAPTNNILDEIDSYVSSFIRGQIIVCTVLFLLYALGLGLLGVELWFVLAFISGYGNLIPYLGFLVGIVLTSIMAVVTFGDLSHVFIAWAIFAGVQALEGTVITPRILGSSVGLSPLTVILAIVAGGSLFGLLGVFLAVPGAAVLKVVLKHTYKWLVTLT